MPNTDRAIQLLREAGIKFVDKRSKGGALWALGGQELEHKMEALYALGYRFHFTAQGGKATHYRASWYLRNEDIAPTVSSVPVHNPQQSMPATESIVSETEPRQTHRPEDQYNRSDRENNEPAYSIVETPCEVSNLIGVKIRYRLLTGTISSASRVNDGIMVTFEYSRHRNSMRINLGDGLRSRVVFPADVRYSSVNFTSLVEALELGESSYLATVFLTDTQTHTSDGAYESHCWNCGRYINSTRNERCRQCGWYKCNECGSCQYNRFGRYR